MRANATRTYRGPSTLMSQSVAPSTHDPMRSHLHPGPRARDPKAPLGRGDGGRALPPSLTCADVERRPHHTVAWGSAEDRKGSLAAAPVVLID